MSKYTVNQNRRSGAGTEDNPLTDIQVQDLANQGIYEGDYVAGKGVLSPLGTFQEGVSTIPETPIITSQDSSNQFQEDSDALDAIINAPRLEDPEDQTDAENDGEAGGEGGAVDDGSGDDLYDNYRTAADEARARAENEAKEVLLEYDNLYEVELAAIDARTRSTVKEIKRSFKQRIDEQKRFNKINVDRIKAYGLASGAAQYTPIAWTDAITERERKNAAEIQGLERERQDLIDAAKAAQDESDAALLSQKISDYNAVKDKLNQRLKDIEKDSAAQYEELRRLREEAEADFKEKQQESLMRLQAYYRLNPDEVANLSDEEKEALVNRIASKYGFETYEVLAVIDEATAPDFDRQMREAELDSERATAEQRRASANASDASAAAAYALAAQRRDATERAGEDGQSGNDYSDQEKRKLRQAGLDDAPQQVQDDYLYGEGEFADSVQDYLNNGGGGGTMDNTGGSEDDPLGVF